MRRLSSRFEGMKSEREKQSMPEEIVGDLLGAIRRDFCEEMSARKWGQSERFFMRVVTYPASQFNRQGVTVSPERYKAILLEIFKGIKQHGKTEAVGYWPGYLLRCVQRHWACHGHDYYEEGKSIRSAVERAAMAYSGATSAPSAADAIPGLAAVNRLLSKRSKRVRNAAPKQAELGF